MISKTKVRTFLLVFSLFIYISCSKDTNNPVKPTDNYLTSDQITIGNITEEISQTVDQGGGKIIISNSKSDLNGLEITIPEEGYNEVRTFNISSAPITNHKFGDYFNPISPLIIIKNGGGYSKLPMKIKIPITKNKEEFIIGFLFNEVTGELEAVPVSELEDSYIVIETRHFSTSSLLSENSLGKTTNLISSGNLIISSILESILLKQTIIDTRFIPGVDDWEFLNCGSYITHQGQCYGQSATALWYFYEKKLNGEANLFHHFDKINNSAYPSFLWEDNPLGYRFVSIIQEDDNQVGWKEKIDLQSRTPNLTWQEFLYSMLITGKPQLVFVKTSAKNEGHAMITYKINVTEGKMYIADPNFPNNRDNEGTYTERTISYSNGEFKPYPSYTKIGDKGIEFDQIAFAGKTANTNWSQIAKRYKEVESKTIGDDSFPEYDIYAKTGEGDEGTSILNVNDTLKVLKDSVTIYCYNPNIPLYMPGAIVAGLQYFIIYDLSGNILASAEPKGTTILKLHPGINRIGIYACGATAADTLDNYVNYKYYTINYDKTYSLSITPNPLIGKKDTKYEFTANSHGTAPNEDSKFVWDFGDNTDLVSVINDSTVSHTFLSFGNYSIKVELYQNSTNQKLIDADSEAEISEGGPCKGITKVYYGGGPNNDIGGNYYKTVEIGDQCWLKENLNVGETIHGDLDMQNGNGIEKYCYSNNGTGCLINGGLYQWDEAMQYSTGNGAQGICPVGWHIPTYDEFLYLLTYVNNETGKLVDESQSTKGYTASNETGFSALFAGYRSKYFSEGRFNELNNETWFWMSTEEDNNYSWFMGLRADATYSTNYFSSWYKNGGLSVRCIKD